MRKTKDKKRGTDRKRHRVKSNAGKTNDSQSVWSSTDLTHDRQEGENSRILVYLKH